MRGLAFVILLGCAGASAQPAQPAPPAPTVVTNPIGPPLVFADEAMVYVISFRGIQVARVQVAIGKPGFFEGRPAIIIKARGATDGVLALLGEIDWQLSTTIDLENGEALHMREEADVKVAGQKEHVERDRKPEVHTVLSAAAMIRGWRSVPNQRAQLAMRIDAAHIALDFHEAGHDFVESQAKPAVRYAGIAMGKFPFELWLSDDVARVPLVMKTATKWGSITVELVEYTAPKD